MMSGGFIWFNTLHSFTPESCSRQSSQSFTSAALFSLYGNDSWQTTPSSGWCLYSSQFGSRTQKWCQINDKVHLEKPERDFFLRTMLHTLAKAERGKKTQKQTDLSFWSYWSICRVCVPVRYPLCSVWFSGQWVDALHSHRSVAGWCPGRFLCEPTRQRETRMKAWHHAHFQAIHPSRHTQESLLKNFYDSSSPQSSQSA